MFHGADSGPLIDNKWWTLSGISVITLFHAFLLCYFPYFFVSIDHISRTGCLRASSHGPPSHSFTVSYVSLHTKITIFSASIPLFLHRYLSVFRSKSALYTNLCTLSLPVTLILIGSCKCRLQFHTKIFSLAASIAVCLKDCFWCSLGQQYWICEKLLLNVCAWWRLSGALEQSRQITPPHVTSDTTHGVFAAIQQFVC